MVYPFNELSKKQPFHILKKCHFAAALEQGSYRPCFVASPGDSPVFSGHAFLFGMCMSLAEYPLVFLGKL